MTSTVSVIGFTKFSPPEIVWSTRPKVLTTPISVWSMILMPLTNMAMPKITTQAPTMTARMVPSFRRKLTSHLSSGLLQDLRSPVVITMPAMAMMVRITIRTIMVYSSLVATPAKSASALLNTLRLSLSSARAGLPWGRTTRSPTSSVNLVLPSIFSSCARVLGTLS